MLCGAATSLYPRRVGRSDDAGPICEASDQGETGFKTLLRAF